MNDTTRAIAIIDAVKAKHPSWRDVKAHASALPREAGALARLLARPEVKASVDAYTAASKAASGARDLHKEHAGKLTVAGLLIAVISGVMLFLEAYPALGRVVSGLSLVQLLIVLYVLGSAAVLMFVKPHKTWSSERSRAERQRIEHFRVLLQADGPLQSDELALMPLQLEYARAFLIDDQRVYFAKRKGDFAGEVRATRLWRGVAVVLIGAAAIPVVLAFLSSPWLAGVWPAASSLATALLIWPGKSIFTLAGVVGGALQAYLLSRSATTLAERNAAVYGRMEDFLTGLAAPGGDLDKAREAAVRGDRLGLERFWLLVSVELAAEHREWGATLGLAQSLMFDVGTPLKASGG